MLQIKYVWRSARIFRNLSCSGYAPGWFMFIKIQNIYIKVNKKKDLRSKKVSNASEQMHLLEYEYLE